MTTKINLFNEGPYDVVVEEIEYGPGQEGVVNTTRKTVLSKSQGIETYIWKEKAIVVKEVEKT